MTDMEKELVLSMASSSRMCVTLKYLKKHCKNKFFKKYCDKMIHEYNNQHCTDIVKNIQTVGEGLWLVLRHCKITNRKHDFDYY